MEQAMCSGSRVIGNQSAAWMTGRPALCGNWSPCCASSSASLCRRGGALGRQGRSPQLGRVACAVGESSMDVGRRQACLEMAAVLASVELVMARPEDAQAREVEVGSYLPASADPRFVQFRASSTDTPALRAVSTSTKVSEFVLEGSPLSWAWGLLLVQEPLWKALCRQQVNKSDPTFTDPLKAHGMFLTAHDDPYGFVLPPTWKQERVANILSGNYCQPKCAEPWVEVKFADAKQGAIQVVAAPMVRLTNKPNATIDEIGSPEKILAALGPFVTGNSFDPEEVTGTSVLRRGDQTYYSYELETPFARTGAHNLATATAKGSVVMLFVVSANDAQWSSSEKLLRSIVDSFGV